MAASGFLKESVVEDPVDASGDGFLGGFPPDPAKIEARAACEALSGAEGGFDVDLE